VHAERIWNDLHQGTFKDERLKNQIYNSFGARKPMHIKSIVKLAKVTYTWGERTLVFTIIT
jgi:hypothetical protein